MKNELFLWSVAYVRAIWQKLPIHDFDRWLDGNTPVRNKDFMYVTQSYRLALETTYYFFLDVSFVVANILQISLLSSLEPNVWSLTWMSPNYPNDMSLAIVSFHLRSPLLLMRFCWMAWMLLCIFGWKNFWIEVALTLLLLLAVQLTQLGLLKQWILFI